jgi:hypothetical protein
MSPTAEPPVTVAAWTEAGPWSAPWSDGDLEGWPAMQFIETSSITIHADEVSGRCFVDVFSRRGFDADAAAAVAVAHFGGAATVRELAR